MIEATLTPRTLALSLFQAGLAAADPAAAVHRALADVALPSRGRRAILGLGKAACSMVEAALAAAPPRPQDAPVALVVTDDANARPVAGAEVLVASHPVPDARGLAAAQRVMALAQGLGPDDQLLVLVSGGGSALLPAPAGALTLADKAEVNRLLLASGADIVAMNLVRQALSRLKGGGLARLAQPAQVVALILSDVMGDDLRVIASGPTARPIGSRADAAVLLRDLGLWPRLPISVRAHLQAADPDIASDPAGRVDNILIGSNAASVAAMMQAALDSPAARAFDPAAAPTPLVGDVRAAAHQIAQRIVQNGPDPAILMWGGETTVALGPWAGQGGRNQELALRVALLAEAGGAPGPWCFLSAGTDGRDGPTDAAGGIVDQASLARMRAAGHDPAVAAAAHDALPVLEAAGDLVRIGGTGTNVADLAVLICGLVGQA